MTMPVASPGLEWPSPAFDEDARNLAGWLRSRRLSALVGTANASGTALLSVGVLPLLRRRAADVARMPASRVVIPFPERRRRGRGGSSEVAVFFDAWEGAAPLVRMLSVIHAALGLPMPQTDVEGLSLAGSLAALNMQSGARFLLILDRFEQCLRGAAGREDLRHLLDELAQALNRPLLPVHALVCASEGGGIEGRKGGSVEPLLAAFFSRVPGNDGQVLRLGEERDGAPGESAAETIVSTAATPEAPTLSQADWLASIGAIVARVADSARNEGRGDDVKLEATVAPGEVAVAPPIQIVPVAESTATPPAVDLDLDLPYRAAPVAEASPIEHPPVPEPAAARSTERPIGPVPIPWFAWVGAALAAAVAAYFVWPAPPPALAPAARPAAAPTAAPVDRAAPAAVVVPPTAVVVTPADEGSVRWRRELAGAVATPATSGPAVTWPPGFDAVAGQPGLALARYDVLQAARAASPSLPFRIVTPLASEALYFVVQADSPRRFIHDIRGASLGVGRAGSSRALSAEAAYQRLFGAEPNVATDGGLEPDAALGPLLRGALDVLVLIDTPPADWLARLPPATAGALRVLQLDPADAADRRALQVFLPARLPRPPGAAATTAPTTTLAEMSFLVAADDAEGGRAASSLCSRLPSLRRDGAPAWRSLSPGQALPTGWPMSLAAQQVWRDCRALSG